MEKRNKTIYILIISVLVIIIFVLIWYFVFNKKDNSSGPTTITNNNYERAIVPTASKTIETLEEVDLENIEEINDLSEISEVVTPTFIEGDFLADGVVTTEEFLAMQINTLYFQDMINNAEEGQVIEVPSGIYYFTPTEDNFKERENFIIRPRSNISIIGAGTDESGDSATVFKPYAKDGVITYGLDMFYFNDYMDSAGANPNYLENVKFSDFIIDGEDVRGNFYDSSGKGFMINLCKNCHWDNIIVRNTDATGFGMDNLIDCSIKNCTAINCGKNATETSEGASGFGIGSGYSDDESVYIENCKAINNKKFGFFFEHQGRFTNYYKASRAEGFVVVNSSASGNLYNFGGLRANDVAFSNCSIAKESENSNYTKLDLYFSDESRRTYFVNFKDNNSFVDVSTDSIYYDYINWAYKNNIVMGTGNKEFGGNQNITRAETISLIWRYAQRPGDVLDDSQLKTTRKYTNIITGFYDVDGGSWYASAVKWGVDNKITNGTSDTTFSPQKTITRAEAITLLWRFAGSPKINSKNIFVDVSTNAYYYDAVNWAYEKGITNGTSSNTFNPNNNCTREQMLAFLYRYDQSKNVKASISYMLMGGEAYNSKSYITGKENITLNNPTKEGYRFIGWTGSNGTTPEKNYTISKNETGNKIYIANYEPIEYTIKFDSNGGRGSMKSIKAEYNEYVPLSENEFEKNGATFAGWSLSKNGNVDYKNEDIVRNLTTKDFGTITLYAVWK